MSFTHIEGYTDPAPQTVNVVAGQTTTVQGNFVLRTVLRVITNPAVPGTISVDAIPRDDWGMWTDIPSGAHQVCFGPVPGLVRTGLLQHHPDPRRPLHPDRELPRQLTAVRPGPGRTGDAPGRPGALNRHRLGRPANW